MTGPVPRPWPRAVSTEPLYVARSAVVAGLDATVVGRAADPVERRSAYVLLVLLGLGLPRVGADRVGGAGAPDETFVALDPHRLAARAGLPRGDCQRGLDLLLDAGLLLPADVGALGPDRVARLAPALFHPQPTADAVDWDRVLPAIEGSAPTVLTAWAFAELLRRPDRYASVPRAEVQAHTMYGEGMVKRALAALVAAGVIDRSGANAYRFTDAALGRGPALATNVAPAAALGSPGRQAPAAPQPAASPRAASADLVAFSAAGIRLELPRDTTIELEGEVDGQPTRLRLRFPSA